MRTGTTVSHYRVGDLIGRGGMGEGYRAVDTRLDRPVALKFLAARFVSDAEAKERSIREAKAASALEHPNICTIHDTNAYERLGRIHEEAGRTADAIYYYERLVGAWADASAPLIKRRERVQGRLDALTSTAGSS
jgi:hypothetical protein